MQSGKRYLLTAGITMLVQFIVFKYLYPFPNFMQDSYNYLRSAVTNADANLWPVGYAKLIRFTGFFSHSDTLLVFTQYFFYHICALYFFFTVLDFAPVAWVRRTVFIFLFLNPAILYLSNYITSDVYFIGISLVWIAQLFRLSTWHLPKYLPKPELWLLGAHLLTLLLAFTVRYHALIYPVISLTVLVFCQFSVRVKVGAVLLTGLMIGGFVRYTTYENERVMGVHAFSPFSGWQMASNALYAYARMPQRPPLATPPQFAAVQQRVMHYMDAVPPSPGPIMATYIWDPYSPLQPSPGAVNIADNPAHLRRMAAVAPLYNDYGKFLINEYPLAYIRYYLLPNALQYCNPPAENLAIYNDGADTTWPVAQQWFGYKKVHTVTGGREMIIFDYYPAFMVFIILLFIGCWIVYFRVDGASIAAIPFRKALRIATFYWLVHYAFSTLASPVVLRYQLFNMILGVTFSAMLIDLYWRKEAFKNKAK